MINDPGVHKNHPATGHIVAMLHKLLRSRVDILLVSGRNDSKIVIPLLVQAIHFSLLRSVHTGSGIYAATCNGYRVSFPGGNAIGV